jgi:tRNA A-37 threonylcarbamoyl transferase component Bud32/tetratricopeptide (TPR) repeat protein
VIGKAIGHYCIDAFLGAGGMGDVYKAHDSILGRRVALKFLKRDTAESQASVARFIQEAKAASALNHPNIITIYEVFETAEGHFIAMELVEGETLRALIGRDVSLPTFVRVGEQIARALAVAHAADITHRDIKPENIMLRSDGYAKLLDFGVARLNTPFPQDEVTVRDLTAHGIVGSLRYMSPEQARGNIVGPKSDMFSLGIVLYEFATGQHPFAARSSAALEVVSAILNDPVVSPSFLNVALSGNLEQLILKLLQKDPELRPDAAEVVRQFSEYRAEEPEIGSAATLSSVSNVHFVGRDRERQELLSIYHSASTGKGQFVCIAGEAGIGKTTLVDELINEVAHTKCILARGRCAERLAGNEAYLPLLECLEDLLRQDPSTRVRATMKALAPNWYAQVVSGTSLDTSEVKANSQDRLKRELVSLFEDLSKERTLLLFIDDVHWADASTVDFLAYVGTRINTLRAVIFTTFRPSELKLSNHAFSQLKLHLQSRGLCRSIELHFLAPADVREYLDRVFPGHTFPADFAAAIHAKTEGNPLFMADVVRYLHDSGSIQSSNGVWNILQSTSEIEGKLPESIKAMIERKLDQVDSIGRRILEVGSIQGAEFDSALVADVLQIDPADVEDKLQGLHQLHALIEPVKEDEFSDGSLNIRYHFVHALYQNALYGSLSPSRRASFARVLAGSLERHQQRELPQLAAKLAFLYEIGRDFDRASKYFLMAAINAAAVFANQEVALLSRRGLKLLSNFDGRPDLFERRRDLLLKLGVALMTTKGYTDPELETVYQQAKQLCEQLQDKEKLFPVLWGLQACYFVRAQITTALDLADQMLDLANTLGNAAFLVEAHHAKGFTLLHIGELHQALTHLEKSIELYRPEMHRDAALLSGHDFGVIARCFKARALWRLGFPDRALAIAHEALDIAQQRRHPYSLAFANAYVAMIHESRLEPRETEKWAEKTLEIARQENMNYFISRGSILRGWSLAQQGDVGHGLAELQAGFAAADSTGTMVTRLHVIALLSEIFIRIGRNSDAAKWINEGLEWMEKSGVCDYESELYRLQADLLLTQNAGLGPVPEAEILYQRAIHVAQAQGARSFELRSATSFAQYLIARGQLAQAHAILDPVRSWFREGLNTPDLLQAAEVLSEDKPS